jgi:hypothetical protein
MFAQQYVFSMEASMNTTKKPYEAPTLRCDGDAVQLTRRGLFREVEADGTGLYLMGSVGFGV